MPASRRDLEVRSGKEEVKAQQAEAVQEFARRQHEFMENEIRKVQRRKLLQAEQLEQRQQQERMSRRQAQMEAMHAMILRHHATTQDLEYRHLESVHLLRDDHMRRQHRTELDNQESYMTRAQRELKHKHATAVKQLPKSLKAKEQEIKRQYQDAAKTQQKQFKVYREHQLLRTSKAEQKELMRRLKEEQMRRMAMLSQQYDNSIAEMVEHQNVRMDASQVSEISELRERLQQELELLVAYQSKTRMQMDAQHQRERKELEQRVSLRRALIEQQIEEDTTAFAAERSAQTAELLQRQTQELQYHDLETATMGLSLAEIVAATEDFYQDDGGGGAGADADSVRGSMLSLTPSSSRQSFSPFSPAVPANTAI
jgi:thousand and one amino acid protein kinase